MALVLCLYLSVLKNFVLSDNVHTLSTVLTEKLDSSSKQMSIITLAY